MTTNSYNPFFSIIIPTLNEELYLPHLLKDLKQQSFNNFEIIIVDGNSTDRTQEITKKNNTLLILSTKRNVAYQRNLGGKKAKGKYLLFIDADTRIPHYYLEGLKYQSVRTNADFFTTWLSKDNVEPKDRVFVTFLNLSLETNKNSNFQVALGAMLGCKKSAFNKICGFNEKITFAEDAEFIRRARANGFSYKVFKDPRFNYSLRRLKRDGMIPILRNTAKLSLKIILNGYPEKETLEYPMLGGSSYKISNKNKNLINYLNKTTDKLKKYSQKEKFQKLFDLFNS